MNEVTIQEDRETGLCDVCKKEAVLHRNLGDVQMICDECEADFLGDDEEALFGL